MFNTASGVRIPFPNKIEEKYVLTENLLKFNISSGANWGLPIDDGTILTLFGTGNGGR
jgi:hypothetical protein